jgi:hypothetical protein
MVSRSAVVTGRGFLDLLSGSTTVPVAPIITPTSGGTQTINSNLESAVVQAPISREDMWAFTGTPNYGSYSNFQWTSVVQTDGPGGASSKVLNQHFGYNGGTNYAADPTGTGLTLTSAVLAGGPVDEASIEFDFRCKPSVAGSGTPWGYGGKIPGLAGVHGSNSVPTGGNPSPNGFSARCMWRRENATSLRANLVGYFYSPQLAPNSIGNDLATGQFLYSNQWHHIKQYHKMNTVTTEGSTTPPADGIHRIWLDGVLVYESLTTVYRFYSDANINRLCWDNFYGGNDANDGFPWGPRVDADQQFDNFVVTTFPSTAAPAADTTPPSTPVMSQPTNITASSFTVSWAPSTDNVGVTTYYVRVGSETFTTTGTSYTVTSRAAATDYTVRVQAKDAAGNYGSLSPTITVTTASSASASGFGTSYGTSYGS